MSALPGLLLAMLLGALDHTIITPALPAIAADLGDLAQMPYVVTAYLAAATVVMPVYGKLGDGFGRKPVMQVAIGVFLTGALLCTIAGSMGQLAVFRAIQGAGGGGLMIGAQAIIGETVSPRERGRYLGLVGAVYAIAVVGGPVVGGFLIDRFSWQWIFLLYLPLGVLAFGLLTATLRLPKPSARPSLDLIGALTLAVAVIGTVLFGQTGGPVWMVVALIGLAAWLVSARYARDPILPVHLLRDPAFAVPIAVSFLLGFALIGTITYLPAIVQLTSSATATQAGILITALMTGVLAATVVSGRIITKTGRYKAFPIAGTAIMTAGLALLAASGTPSRIALAGVLLLIGLGAGLVMQVMVLAAQNGVGYEHLGTATSSVTFLRQIGASLGVAVMGAVLTPYLTGEAAHTVTQRFVVMVPLMAVAFVLALALPARPLRKTAHIEEMS